MCLRTPHERDQPTFYVNVFNQPLPAEKSGGCAGARRVSPREPLHPTEELHMSTQSETGDVTGTKDKDYNIIWFTEKCLDLSLIHI